MKKKSQTMKNVIFFMFDNYNNFSIQKVLFNFDLENNRVAFSLFLFEG